MGRRRKHAIFLFSGAGIGDLGFRTAGFEFLSMCEHRYDFHWGPLEVAQGKRRKKIKMAPDSLIRLVIGESVPPLFFELLGGYILSFSDREPRSEGGKHYRNSHPVQLTLF